MPESVRDQEFVEYLPSDRVSYIVGLSQHIPDELSRAFSTEGRRERLTFFLNTWYPEVSGGYYLNHRLIRILGDSIEQMGLHIVDPEYINHYGVVPTEQLEWCDAMGTVYVLIDEDFDSAGWTLRWEYGACSGCRLFDTSHMVDVVAEKQVVDAIVDIARDRLGRAGIGLQEADSSKLEEAPCRSVWDWIKCKLVLR